MKFLACIAGAVCFATSCADVCVDPDVCEHLHSVELLQYGVKIEAAPIKEHSHLQDPCDGPNCPPKPSGPGGRGGAAFPCSDNPTAALCGNRADCEWTGGACAKKATPAPCDGPNCPSLVAKDASLKEHSHLEAAFPWLEKARKDGMVNQYGFPPCKGNEGTAMFYDPSDQYGSPLSCSSMGVCVGKKASPPYMGLPGPNEVCTRCNFCFREGYASTFPEGQWTPGPNGYGCYLTPKPASCTGNGFMLVAEEAPMQQPCDGPNCGPKPSGGRGGASSNQDAPCSWSPSVSTYCQGKTGADHAACANTVAAKCTNKPKCEWSGSACAEKATTAPCDGPNCP